MQYGRMKREKNFQEDKTISFKTVKFFNFHKLGYDTKVMVKSPKVKCTTLMFKNILNYLISRT